MNLDVLTFLIGSRLNSQEQGQLFEIMSNNIELFEKMLPDSSLLAHIKKEKTWDHTLAQAYDAWLAKRG